MMKNKIIIILSSILFSGHILAQGNLFIRPIYKTKFSFAFVDPNDYTSIEKKVFSPQGMDTPYMLSKSSRINKPVSLDLGLAFGYQFAENKKSIQVSWNRDHTGYNTESYFKQINSVSFDGTGWRSGKPIHRITIDYSTRINKTEKLNRLWLSFGLGTFINFNKNTDVPIKTQPNYYVAQNVKLMEIYFQPVVDDKINFFLKFGFENDFHIKNKYLFSFSTYYVQGFGRLSRVEYINKYIINNELITNSISILSRGSGFYLQLSHKFNIWSLSKKLNEK